MVGGVDNVVVRRLPFDSVGCPQRQFPAGVFPALPSHRIAQPGTRENAVAIGIAVRRTGPPPDLGVRLPALCPLAGNQNPPTMADSYGVRFAFGTRTG